MLYTDIGNIDSLCLRDSSEGLYLPQQSQDLEESPTQCTYNLLKLQNAEPQGSQQSQDLGESPTQCTYIVQPVKIAKCRATRRL